MSSNAYFSMLMLVAGFGIPIMASLNSSLGAQLSSPTLATTILFAVALATSFIYLLKIEGLPADIFYAKIPWHLYCGGLLVAFYILSVTWVAPKFGVGNAISFILLGQLLAITLIDHFGWFGARQVSIGTARLIGIALMVLGVYLVVKRAT